jgi:quercetin dioxygenase-like cupin family protein
MSGLNGGNARTTCRRRASEVQEHGDENSCADRWLVFGWDGPFYRWHRTRTVFRSHGLQGVKESVLAAIDLTKEIDSVESRELRVSRSIVAPGGHIGLHNHQGDPTIVYVLDGVLTNHHDDGTTEEFRSGQVFAEFGPRSHWVENNGPTPVVIIAANIHRRE